MQVIDDEYAHATEVDQLVHDGSNRIGAESSVGAEEVQGVGADDGVEGAERPDGRGPEIGRVGIGHVARQPGDRP